VIFIVARMTVKREFSDAFPTLTEQFRAATRAEPGNVFFELSRDVADQSVYYFTEAFSDEGAGQSHVESDHFTTIVAELPRWLADVPEIINVTTDASGWQRMGELAPLEE
jgi:quinol monooxygenase YgiN